MTIALKPSVIPSISPPKPLSLLPQMPNRHVLFKPLLEPPKPRSKSILFAQNDPKQQNGSTPDLREERNPIFSVKLGDLLLNPDPDNILAVGLTGLLAWASAQVLWQLLIVSLSILLAAVKYSFIAALLVFILITLL